MNVTGHYWAVAAGENIINAHTLHRNNCMFSRLKAAKRHLCYKQDCLLIEGEQPVNVCVWLPS